MKKIVAITLAAIIALTGTFGMQEAYAAEAVDKTEIETELNKENTVDTEKVEKTEIKVEKPIVVNPVTGLRTALYSSNKVVVTWKKQVKADGYQVLKKNSKKQWVVIKTIKGNKVTTYKTGKLAKGKTYTYGVRAYKVVKGKKVVSKIKASQIYVPKVMKRSTKGFNNTTAGKLIKAARNKLGCRYVSGCEGPTKFDCSGFVYYISNKSNATTIKFSRTTAAGTWSKLKKYSIGTTKLSKAQPGDIVFTASMGGSRITHTAFYYGDNKYIHATNPRQGVTITPAKYYGKVVGIVRLPNL